MSAKGSAAKTERLESLVHMDTVIWRVSPGTPEFDWVVQVRQSTYGRESPHLVDAVDDYSEHYVAMQHGDPVAALRSTRAARGPLDCEEFAPAKLLRQFRSVIGSATRFVAIPEVRVGTRIPYCVMAAAWRDGLSLGVRLDMIDVHRRGLAFYGRLGYRLVKGSDFVHPVWNTPSYFMVLPANCACDSFMSSTFAQLEDCLSEARLLSAVDLDDWQRVRASRRTGRLRP